jgi:hypothetical protein
MRPLSSCTLAALVSLLGIVPGTAQQLSTPPPAATDGFVNDFPTAARADYVFGCMAVNGETRDALERCSCSIDIIASLITYEEYESGETVLMVAQRGGENTAMFKTSPLMQAKVDKVRRAQTEAELRCF